DNRTQILRGANDEQRFAIRHFGQIAGRADRRAQRQPLEKQRVFMGGVDCLDHFGLARPERDRLAIGRRNLRESGAPGAAANDPDPHAFTPAPRAFSASGSSGQRARAGASSPSTRPASKRSAPAQPIIAALSVQSHKGGATKGRPWLSARPVSAVRTAWLAATPPATTSAVAPSAISSARRVRSRKQSTTACWKLAAISVAAYWPLSFARRTALLRPAKLKCGSAEPTRGRGKGTA